MSQGKEMMSEKDLDKKRCKCTLCKTGTTSSLDETIDAVGEHIDHLNNRIDALEDRLSQLESANLKY
jgi:hypothetical protein